MTTYFSIFNCIPGPDYYVYVLDLLNRRVQLPQGPKSSSPCYIYGTEIASLRDCIWIEDYGSHPNNQASRPPQVVTFPRRLMSDKKVNARSLLPLPEWPPRQETSINPGSDICERYLAADSGRRPTSHPSGFGLKLPRTAAVCWPIRQQYVACNGTLGIRAGMRFMCDERRLPVIYHQQAGCCIRKDFFQALTWIRKCGPS